MVLFWGPPRHQHLVAYIVVGLTWLFIGLFITITVSINTDGTNFYDSPVGVSSSLLSSCCIDDMLR